VRENYLTKVAIEKNIGERIFFQGATAKNRALVAAFEQRLGRPVMVSKFCHLTGALGCALHLADEKFTGTTFRGVDIYRQSIPVRSEVCDLCANSCKVKVAEVNDETVAFGFLCGRDYETKKFVNTEDSGFNLLKERKRITGLEKLKQSSFDFTIGIPAALYLFEDTRLWSDFFTYLGIKTGTSENYKYGVRDGKNIAAAEFCAPMSEMHGHAAYLAGRCDYLFLPVYIENKSSEEGARRHYCYYSQYLPPVIKASGLIDSSKILSPLLRSGGSSAMVKLRLFKALKKITGGKINYMQISSAYDRALKNKRNTDEKLKSLYKEKFSRDDVNILLLGRDYTVLSKHMNKGIPDIFSRLGARVFFQDMLPERKGKGGADGILNSFHWSYAAEILDAAAAAAETDGLYPVFVTSFKCTPDSYAVEYFKKIMDASDKPYLILQLDEHDSSVGYETRIEAGLRSFRNHFNINSKKVLLNEKSLTPVVTGGANALKGKILLLPRWDSITGEFMVSVLRNEGVDARLVEESRDSIQRSLSHNTGQCIPLNIIVQNSADYIRKYNLDPAKTVMWNISSSISCNLGMFPYYCKTLMESMGGGMEKVEVYAGDLSFTDISISASINMYTAFMFAGMLRRMGCYIRPYEKIAGSTNAALDKSVKILSEAFSTGSSKRRALEKVTAMFEKIDVNREERPRVAIFGDLYVRDNDVLNQNLIDVIESNGGEVITTPYSELVKIIADPYIRRWFKEGNVWEAVSSKIIMKAIGLFEKRYSPFFNRILNENISVSLPSVDEVLKKFDLEIEHTGESMENALKIYSLINHYSDISFFVQTNPAFCCPSLVTEAMSGKIEKVTGVPIVTIEYDGTGGFKNDDIIPYLKFPRKRRGVDGESGMISIA
jgi:predicted nucleotide-binding protein (sugar kinase/HSP70/actin superfamily)